MKKVLRGGVFSLLGLVGFSLRLSSQFDGNQLPILIVFLPPILIRLDFKIPPPLPAITTFFYPVFSPSFHRISIESVDHFLRNMGMGKPGNNCGSAQKKSKEVAFLRLRSGRGLLSWFTEETRQEPGNVVFLSDIYLCAL